VNEIISRRIEHIINRSEIKGYVRYENADRKLYGYNFDFLGVVVRRVADGKFIPVAILNERNMCHALTLAQVGVVVTNA